MKDTGRILDYLQRKTADSTELMAASLIIGLQAENANLVKQRDDLLAERKQLVAKAGEAMRERCADEAQTEMDEQYIDSDPWYAARSCREAIRTLPGVTLEDLK